MHNHVDMEWSKRYNGVHRTIPIVLLFIFIGIWCISCSPRVVEYGVFAPSRLQFVRGQDGCTPIDFDDTTTIWTFGDTITSEGMICNSLAFTKKLSRESIQSVTFTFYTENNKVAQFIKYEKHENPSIDRLWAFDGIRINDTLFVFYVHVMIKNSGNPLAFDIKESALAYWSIPKNWKIGDTVTFIRKKGLFRRTEPVFGASVVQHGSYVYVTGQLSEKGKSWIVIGRVVKDNIAQRDAYEFLQRDKSWDKQLNSALRLYGDVAGECSLNYDEETQSFYIIYCQIFSGSIVMYRAKRVEDLADAKQIQLYTPPVLNEQNMMYYSAKAIFHDSNRWYIVYMHPCEHQPYLIAVRLLNE